MIALVAALARNRVIGAAGRLPWHLPADLTHFRNVTMGHTVVMGRLTHTAIGRPLPGRKNIVLTRNPAYVAPGCRVVRQPAEILALTEPCFVIGGAEIYTLFLPYAEAMYLTLVHTELPGDTFFPAFDRTEWRLVQADFRPRDEQNTFDLTFETYRRPS